MSKRTMRNSWFVVLTFVLALAMPSLAEQRTVLIVYSYDEGLAWTRQCDKGIREALPGDVSIERLFMDTKRIPQEKFISRAEMVVKEFRRIQPDLVMVSDDTALRLVGPEIAATGVPVVYFGINGNPRDYFVSLPKNVTGLIERIPLLHWVRILFDIIPEADSLLVLMDTSPTADAIIKSSFRGRDWIEFEEKTVGWKKATDWADWQRSVLESESEIILMPIYHSLKNENGTHIPYDEVVSWTSKNSPVPVFATQDYAVGDQGVIGALVVFGEEHGRLAGVIAKKILDGISVLDLSTADDQHGIMYFNPKGLKRFDIHLPKAFEGKVIYKQ
ncbi:MULTISPECIES: ABC transporter substrate binding protein [unclassified Pseudodesulfovibrio]|uniref:ABC transporter substrate-binding protein n=1 Tax=unclassified Pseudodesulfovibrio TaxID=2661612 RepID=UPI000FEBFB9A|nr:MULTISPECIES: ABC transporter substrate binding protein [unclassified Pseudodesulfovibrio]MCJ2163412.1 hypothetical protein [Pseudodesulfovibrio sp. S3-i]RWU06649.1 hypothetical protein DWB63_02485 [Pseudodesulfovibrio sp. S3]